jgi:ankyrin repeat protein
MIEALSKSWTKAQKKHGPREEPTIHFERLKMIVDSLNNFNSPDANGETGLIYAASKGHKKIVDVLLKLKTTEINATDKSGKAALEHAANNGQKEIVDALLERRDLNVESATEIVNALLSHKEIDINALDNEDKTTLTRAIASGHTAMVLALIARQEVNLNTVNKDRKTPLMLAAHKDQKEIVDALLREGRIDIDAQDKNGRTALVQAIAEGNMEVAQLLINNGADVSIKDNNGRSALTMMATIDKTMPLLDQFIPDPTQKEKFIKAIRTSEILNLSYSVENKIYLISLANRVNLVNDTITDIISEDAFLENAQEQKKILKEATDIMKNGEFRSAAGERLRIVRAPFKDHAAYFVVEYDENSQPIKLSYIDGNCPLSPDKEDKEDKNNKYRAGAVTFEINAKKIGRTSPEAFEAHLQQIFSGQYPNKKELNNRLAPIVLCKGITPKVIAESTPTVPQKRSNSTLKSFDILLRFIIEKCHPNLEFGTDFPEGPGVDLYKQYFKGPLIEKCFDDTVELIEKEQELRKENASYEKPLFFDSVMDDLKQCLEQAERKPGRKKNLPVAEAEIHKNRAVRIKAILAREKEYLAERKKGPSPHPRSPHDIKHLQEEVKGRTRVTTH